MNETNDAMTHLIRIIGLCQTPRESWTSEDSRLLKEAREFIQKHREDRSERQREETSSATTGNSAPQLETGEAAEGVQRKGVPVETGTERTDEHES